MNTSTGEIKEFDMLSFKDRMSKKWLPLNEKQNNELQLLNRKQRRDYLKNHGKLSKGVWGWL